VPASRHRTEKIHGYRRGDINYPQRALVSHGFAFVARTAVRAFDGFLAWFDASWPIRRALSLVAELPILVPSRRPDVPAIKAIGGSLFVFRGSIWCRRVRR